MFVPGQNDLRHLWSLEFVAFGRLIGISIPLETHSNRESV